MRSTLMLCRWARWSQRCARCSPSGATAGSRVRPSATSATASASPRCASESRRLWPDPRSRRRCSAMPSYYPIMLDVRGRLAVVVGGDAVAAEKAAALSACGARVTVVAPAFCDELRALAARPDLPIALREKAYAPGDLDGAFVVVAATTRDPALTEAIWAETQRRGQLVNIVDVPARCSFIMPSILRRGHLTIAVSTKGASPSIAN